MLAKSSIIKLRGIAMDNVKEIRYNSVDMLAPAVMARAKMALLEAQSTGFEVRPFETYRTPNRQTLLYSQGRTLPGKIVTYARAWESFHQYGCALDIVFFINNKPCWNDDLPWDKVAHIFGNYGFNGLKFERPHFEITAGLKWQEAYNLVRKKGIQAFYDVVNDYCSHL